MTAPLRRIGVAVLATAILTGTAGCGLFGDDEEPTPDPTVRKSDPKATKSAEPDEEPGAYSTPDPDDVDFSKPQAVCDAFTDTLFSGSPATEGQTQPIGRAAEYVKAEYKKLFLSNAPRLAQWDDWKETGASQLRRVRLPSVGDASSEDQPKRKYRTATRRVIPSDSQRNPVGQTMTFRVSCTLDHIDGNWLVADHGQVEIDAP